MVKIICYTDADAQGPRGWQIWQGVYYIMDINFALLMRRLLKSFSYTLERAVCIGIIQNQLLIKTFELFNIHLYERSNLLKAVLLQEFEVS